MRRRVQEEGASEGRPVIGRIGVEPSGDSTQPERGQTSLWWERTGKDRQLASGSNAEMSAGSQWPLLVQLPPPRPIGSRLGSRTVQVAA
jgi:hypothetical protein